MALVAVTAGPAVCAAAPAAAAETRVAVASNFADAASVLAERFRAATGRSVVLAFGSTGKHYAQIANGAPFAAFLAADASAPDLLEKEGAAQPGSRFTYARGCLLLWSPLDGYVDADAALLARGDFGHLAIANPGLAPYGKAAREVLEARGLWQSLQSKIVRGENIGQAYQFVVSGNAELGFVACSQVKRPGRNVEGSYWEVPRRLYAPIDQQAVLLEDDATARAFLDYLKTGEARRIIESYGYETP